MLTEGYRGGGGRVGRGGGEGGRSLCELLHTLISCDLFKMVLLVNRLARLKGYGRLCERMGMNILWSLFYAFR